MTRARIALGPVPHFKNNWVQGMSVKKEGEVFHNGSTYRATEDDPSTEPSFTYNPETGEYTCSEGWALVSVGVGQTFLDNLLAGLVIPKLAENLNSWGGNAVPVQEVFSDPVRTTAGDTSVVSSDGARLLSIVPKADFYASALKATGFNLLHDAVSVGAGYYFFVPALPFGSFGTAVKPNGLLFTNNEHENLKPTVYFKPLSSGVPESATDGTACPHTDSNGYRFYNPAQAGFIIVSDITLANTCAHVAWSGRYDEFVSPNAAGDAGSSITLSTIIHALHSYDRMLVIGNKADRITFDGTKAYWTRVIDRVAPQWATTNNGDGTYTHTATISAMLPGGAVECGSLNLSVSETAVSYTDDQENATSDYVKYELATQATGNVNISNALTIEDWGLEMLQSVVGSAYVYIQYSQGIPDSLRALMAGGLGQITAAIAQLLVNLDNRIGAIEDKIASGFSKLITDDLEVRHAVDDFSTDGNANRQSAGAPDFVPIRIGERVFDKTNKVWYTATALTVEGWKLDTNA